MGSATGFYMGRAILTTLVTFGLLFIWPIFRDNLVVPHAIPLINKMLLTRTTYTLSLPFASEPLMQYMLIGCSAWIIVWICASAKPPSGQ